jgi:hypothetical protein
MSIHVVRDILKRRPFEPFRLVLSSGDTYEVRHPETALLVKGGLYIAIPPDADGLPENAVYCSIAHIAAVLATA